MTTTVLTPDQVLEHWQGQRRLTRRVIDAFPEDKLFHYSVGSMRPFAQMVHEFLKMAVPIARGVATGKWEENPVALPATKSELLRLWDEASEQLTQIWPTIPPARFAEIDRAFGQWENPGFKTILYAIDNETHHRGQAYVYLRGLGIEPPPFYERN
ncbi:DinB family protein [Bryobacter aggregatus]|uniref:DinB family protein n=1 Tax=Bryobacter aggregatus TaxID=360054 RepID=UPI0004E139B1|nr:DinB family protein [Bryobacter aggregatus]